jgi:hypothetical protein
VTEKIGFNLRCTDAWKRDDDWRTYVFIKCTKSMFFIILSKNTKKKG